MKRREFCVGLAAASASTARAAAPLWTPEWDRAVLAAGLAAEDRSFDTGEQMLARRVSAEFNYHSGLRGTRAHPTRESLTYAWLLLESGDPARAERAARIVERLAALQETDPGSKFYGIWGYYLEEPAPRMFRADWNWADFNGATLALILARAGQRLPATVREKAAVALRHACESILRRNVTMAYTNIAVQGTFVTMTAAEVLGDQRLREYAKDRLQRFAATVDETGSFAEYNSPNYGRVTIANLTRMQMVVKDAEFLELAAKIQERVWLHLGKHWHEPTMQLAGPMSRCYVTDIGKPLWLQKALGGRLQFASLDEVRGGKASGPGETGVLAYRCPESLASMFLEYGGARQHRELFYYPKPGAGAVHGVTWMQREFTLGSINRSDLWIQRRPLLAYWGDASRPARYLALRFLKDDYDFVSALYYGVQERGCVLGLVNLRSPGGDKHAAIGFLPNAEFPAARLRARFDLRGVPADAAILADGKPVLKLPAEFPIGTRMAVDLGSARLWLCVRATVFGDQTCRLACSREEDLLTISVDLLHRDKPELVRWRDIAHAYAVFTLAMDAGAGTLEAMDRRLHRTAFKHKPSEPAEFTWRSPQGELSLTGNTRVATIEEQDGAFSERLNGGNVPLVRLSDARLLQR
jgi:hypothetical protein